MKSFKSILEDVYTSEYKIKKWVDPATGKTKERKVRPHRVEFDASKLRGEPAQKDAQGDYGMKEETMNEATVKTQKYSWGTMKTIHHGASFSIPLHPQDHEHIAKMSDGQVHNVKTEDGRQWHVKREGDTVHFHGANGGPKTSVPHSSLKEEVESIEEAKMSDTDKKAAFTVHHVLKSGEQVSPGYGMAIKSKHNELKRKYGSDWRKKAGIKEEVESIEEQLLEVLSKDASAGTWISDFVKSDNPKFAGKSKKERIKMALGAYYGKQNEELEEGTDDRKQNALWAQITQHEKQAKATKNDIKRQHHMRMASDLRGQLKTSDLDEGVNDRPKSTEVKSTTALAPMGKSTSGANIKDSSGVAHSAMSRARRLARLALGKKSTNEAKETYKGLEKEDKKGLPTAMIKKSEKAVEGDTVEGWDHPHDAVKEEVQKVDVPAYLRKAKGEKPLELKDLKRKDTISDAENLKKATGIKEGKKSYSDFAMMLEYEVDKNGKYVHKGTYGSSYAKAEREKDEEGFESEPKAKRGPKMGSKRGAKANYGSSKLHTK